MNKVVNIIGAGLAGCEAAYQLEKLGYIVNLYDGKKKRKNNIQKTDYLSELVCSNTFRSVSTRNAVGILKKEMEMLDSIIIKKAYESRIPADDALAVDRDIFSKSVSDEILSKKNINYICEDLDDIDFKIPTIIATGPLTTDAFSDKISKYFGKYNLYFLDASSPIIEKESLNLDYFFFDSRHGDDKSYLCYPMNEDEFNNFYNDLIMAETTELSDVDKEIYFKGCQPIEVLAKQSRKLLLNGPLSKSQLGENDSDIYAVIQLRQDAVKNDLYNLVGFQTNIKWPEQSKVLKKLKGWEKVNITRYGVLYKNKYINSPKVINYNLQANGYNNIFFAGQITGVEGYVESSASGLFAALSLNYYLQTNKAIRKMPDTTVMGSLINYVTNKKHKTINPMKANIGLLPTIDGQFSDKNQKNDAIFARSISDLKKYIKTIDLK